MVDTLTLVLAGVVLYTVLALTLKTQGYLPDWVRVSGPITTLHTERGKKFLDWLARPKRFWRAWGNFGLGIALVVMVGTFALVIFAGVQALSNPTPTALNRPRNVLAIPGVNDFLPLSAAVEILTGLLIGLVVHEGGHGLMCRVEDIEIDSMGLALLAFIPIGAFVEPDEDSRNAASRGAQTRMFAAGVTNNFAVAVVAFALLFGPVVGSIAVVSGVPVGGSLPGSPAKTAGIDRGDVVTGVDGREVENASELDAALATTDASEVSVTLRDGRTASVERKVLVTGSVPDTDGTVPSPVEKNTTIVAVNGTAVHTEGAFHAAARNHSVARLETADGRTVTAPLGAYAVVIPPSEDSPAPMADAGATPESTVVITKMDDARITDRADLTAFLDSTDAGQQVAVTAYTYRGDEFQRQSYDVTLGEHPRDDTGFLGVTAIQPGVTGMVVDDFGIDAYPADFFLGVLGGGDVNLPIDSPFTRAYLTITLPFAVVTIPGVGYAFPGFVGAYANFYTAAGGPLSFLGTGLLLLLGSVLFWTAWINVIIGQFNCTPAFPLDGGHILRTSTQAVVSRLPIDNKYAATKAVTTGVGLLMLTGLLLMIFGPRLLT
ncbi:site-2 protease family protein [Halorarius halobius]|uniref:site-2 protease family protein n=1 Tax=Halorarius halobius TaxID=2962671 RepID=UPI0020CF7400|nr:site-2 protease family protein [Halorarius halobius]